ncbi:MAG: hypothetical protein AB7E79_16605 [Rhodospirillaceae bacterium]
MQAQYKCYFVDRDGTGRSLARINAGNPRDAVEIALKKFPHLSFRSVEVFERADRVLALNDDEIGRRRRH